MLSPKPASQCEGPAGSKPPFALFEKDGDNIFPLESLWVGE